MKIDHLVISISNVTKIIGNLANYPKLLVQFFGWVLSDPGLVRHANSQLVAHLYLQVETNLQKCQQICFMVCVGFQQLLSRDQYLLLSLVCVTGPATLENIRPGPGTDVLGRGQGQSHSGYNFQTLAQTIFSQKFKPAKFVDWGIF